MDKFERICRDIKTVKIQGAENVAKAAIEALMLRSDQKAVARLVSLRPTEPCLRNVVRYVRGNPEKFGPLALSHFRESRKKIVEYTSKKIETGMTVFTHCHSSIVVDAVRKAKEDGKKFRVNCTETRPLFQGRKTARDIASAGVPVTLWVDSGARLALKGSDVFLFGADAITSEGKVVNKIGTEMFAEIAEKYGKGVYCCTNSWKYDPVTVFGKREPIERREGKEVWDKPPRGVQIMNLAFERVNPKLITAIISELGDFTPSVFVSEVRKAYPWLED